MSRRVVSLLFIGITLGCLLLTGYYFYKSQSIKISQISTQLSSFTRTNDAIDENDLPNVFLYYYYGHPLNDAPIVDYQKHPAVYISLKDSLIVQDEPESTMIFTYQAKWAKNSMNFYYQFGSVKIVFKESFFLTRKKRNRFIFDAIISKLSNDYILNLQGTFSVNTIIPPTL